MSAKTTSDMSTVARLAGLFGCSFKEVSEAIHARGIRPAMFLNGAEYYDTEAVRDALERRVTGPGGAHGIERRSSRR